MIYQIKSLMMLYPDYAFSLSNEGNVTWQGDPPPIVDDAALAALDLSYGKESLIVATKIEAQRRVLLNGSGMTLENFIIKQLNYIARYSELDAIEYGTTEAARSLTTLEAQDRLAISIFWGKTQAVRAASNLIERDIQALTDTTGFDVVNSARWPNG